MKTPKNQRINYFFIVFAICLVSLIWTLEVLGVFHPVEIQFQDFLLRHRAKTLPDSQKKQALSSHLIFTVDEKTITEYGFPLSYEKLGSFINYLTDAGVASVNFDFVFQQRDNNQGLDELKNAIKRAENVNLGVFLNQSLVMNSSTHQIKKSFTPEPSISALASVAASNAAINIPVPLGGENIIRNYQTHWDNHQIPSLALATITKTQRKNFPQQFLIDYLLTSLPNGQFSYKGLIKSYSLSPFLQAGKHRQLLQKKLRGRTIFVIPTARLFNDNYLTPMGYLPGGLTHIFASISLKNDVFLTIDHPQESPFSSLLQHFFLTFFLILVLTFFSSHLTLPLSFLLTVFFFWWKLYITQQGILATAILTPLIPLILSILKLVIDYFDERKKRLSIEKMFGQYMNPDLIEYLMAHPEATEPGGQEQDATLLFLDIAGFTSYSETKTPTEVISTLNRYFEFIVEIINQHNGLVQTFMGDAVLAIFGAPRPDENHHLNGVKAGLAIRDAVLRYNLENKELDTLSIRIGVNSGSVVAGNLGSSEVLEYTCIGDAVNLAARIQSIAEPGTLFVGENTWKKIDHCFITEFAGTHQVKGKAAEIKTWCVKSMGKEEIHS